MEIQTMSTRAQIGAFLGRFIPVEHEIKEDEDIFASGYLNSLFVMQLVLFIEETFDLTLENQDLNIENLRTIDAIGRLIERKQLA